MHFQDAAGDAANAVLVFGDQDGFRAAQVVA
jgi:hypothetical protein